MKSELLLNLCAGVDDDTEVKVVVGGGYAVGVERVEIVEGRMYLIMKQDDFEVVPDGVDEI